MVKPEHDDGRHVAHVLHARSMHVRADSIDRKIAEFAPTVYEANAWTACCGLAPAIG